MKLVPEIQSEYQDPYPHVVFTVNMKKKNYPNANSVIFIKHQLIDTSTYFDQKYEIFRISHSS